MTATPGTQGIAPQMTPFGPTFNPVGRVRVPHGAFSEGLSLLVQPCYRRSAVAHHKRKRPKQRRAGCLLCKPQKLPPLKKVERRRARHRALVHELRATIELAP
jgi:hypothetical protein